jgi:hypothetical protein
VVFQRIRPDGALAASGSNGNGGVRYTVSVESTAALMVQDATFAVDDGTAYLDFTTAGEYKGEAELRYAVVPKGSYDGEAPPYSAYTAALGSFGADTHTHTGQLPGLGEGQDLWFLLHQRGKVSAPHKAVFLPWVYVSEEGDDDGGTGTRDKPYGTLLYALDKVMEKHDTYTSLDIGATIAITGVLRMGSDSPLPPGSYTVPPTITITGEYPSITLRDYGTAGGTLKFTGYGTLITVEAGGELTLGGGITLEGNDIPLPSDIPSDIPVLYSMYANCYYDSLVTVAGNLTLADQAVISNHYNHSINNGGGVFVYNGGEFTMSGGVIQGNKTGNRGSGRGGGVFVDEKGKFAKTGGIIYGDANDTPGDGNETDNTAASTKWGHAVCAYLDRGNAKAIVRNDTAEEGVELYYDGSGKAEGATGKWTLKDDNIWY